MKFIQQAWDSLPKEAKVSAFIVLSWGLDTAVQTLKPDVLYFVPQVYRVALYNLILVFLQETKRRLKG